MRPGLRHIRPTLAVVKRDLLLSWSYRLQFVGSILGGLMSLAVFYYVSHLVRVEQFSSAEYFAFVAIGILIYTILNATLNIPQVTLRQEFVAGTFERMLLAPWGAVGAIASSLIFPALYALVTVAGVLCVAAAVFGLHVQWSTIPLSIPVAILSLLSFAPFGILLLASVVLFKKAPPGANYVMAGLALIAGLYFPVALLPEWIRWTSEIQPLTPAVELLRSTLVGQPLNDPAWIPLAKLATFAAIVLPLSVLALRTALRLSRRRGTILEY